MIGILNLTYQFRDQKYQSLAVDVLYALEKKNLMLFTNLFFIAQKW